MATERISPKTPSALKNFVAGGVGGMFLVGAGHPLDTIKVRLQTMSTVPGQAPQYTGLVDCGLKTIRHEGFFGLYRGMAAPLAGVAPMFAVCFLGYGIGQKLQQTTPGEKLSLTQIFFAGCLSGIFTTAIMVPGERIKCVLQIQGAQVQAGHPPKYAGPLDVVRNVYGSSGIRGLYKGTVATLLRDIPGSGAYFWAYEGLKRHFNDRHPQGLPPWAVLLSGGFAGMCNWLISLPPDVLKSRLQTAPEGTYPNGLRDVFKHLVKQEGYVALYKGLAPVMVRAFPANAACFAGYEMTMKALDYLLPGF